jgi:hypothetical protein
MVTFLLGMAWALFSVVFDAYAIWLVWGWHGVALGLPALSVARAVGVSSLVSLFVFRVDRADAEAIINGLEAQELLKRVKEGAAADVLDGVVAVERARNKREMHVLWARRGQMMFVMAALVVVAKIAEVMAR